ncbi:MAG: HEAT repeat domain-containing protein [Sedimentisphaerales bacterium]|nr:HEAT repeat domain-containing protein [Sedimentisphaerales bacterium]
MQRKHIIIIAILACLLVVVVFSLFSRSSENLYYEGRHLAEWLGLAQSTSPQERSQAEQAIREIGPNALPFLEELVSNAYFDSSKVKVRKWIFRKEFPIHDIRRTVFVGYGALGGKARAAVPRLSKMLKDNEATVRSTAAGALGWIGPAANDAVSDLIDVLQHDSVGYVRRDAALALGQICADSNEESVIDVLEKALNDSDSIVKESAKRALEAVQK